MIARYLDLSTAHLTQREADSAGAAFATAGPRVIPHEYGMWVHVQHDDIEEHDAVVLAAGFPNLLAVLQFARASAVDVNWVNLDRDSEVLTDVPVFSW